MSDSPATLIAIAYAARVTRDRSLEKAALDILKRLHGVSVRFTISGDAHQKAEAAH